MARTIAGAAPGRTNRRFLLIAILCAALSAVLVYTAVSRGGGTDDSSTTVPAGTTQVVVAKSAIKQRTTITPEMLQLKAVPSNGVIAGAYVSIEDAIGKVTKYPIEANQQVVLNSVVDTSRPSEDAALAQVVPTGRRAISITASQVINAGGLVLPGDYVDIVWACCKDEAVASKTIVKNIQVAAVAQAIVDSGPVGEADAPIAADGGEVDPEAVTLTLLATPDEGQILLLAEHSGKLRAEVRGVGDVELPDSGTTLITELLTPQDIAELLEGLKPDGYKAKDQQ